MYDMSLAKVGLTKPKALRLLPRVCGPGLEQASRLLAVLGLRFGLRFGLHLNFVPFSDCPKLFTGELAAELGSTRSALDGA